MASGELEPTVSFRWNNADNLPDQSRMLRHLPVRMVAKSLEASDIPTRDHRLMKEPMQLAQPFDAIACFTRRSLAFLADVDAMAAPAELLVGM